MTVFPWRDGRRRGRGMGQRSTLLANTWRKINHHRTEVSKEMKDYIGRPRPGKKRLTGTFNIWHLLCHVGVLQEILYVYFFLSRMKKYLLLLKIKMCFFTITIRVTVTATGYRYYSILYITLTFFPLSFFRGGIDGDYLTTYCELGCWMLCLWVTAIFSLLESSLC